MSVNSSAVLTGAPDQLTTGPILSAVKGTALPTAVSDVLNAAFGDSGYISDEGLTLTPERSTESIRDWSGSEIRQILTEFGATLGWAHLETNETSLRNYLGDNNVTVTAADATNGKRIAAKLANVENPRKSWVFKIKDGNARVLIVVPDGQVTDTGEVAFVKSGAITWPVTLTTYADANGVHVYIYLDDGTVLTAGVPAPVSATPSGAAAGAQVTILGSRFTGSSAVKFGAVSAVFTVVNDSTIVATMPAGSAGSAAVTVTNGSGVSASLAYTRGA
jgi:hypothetical protein